MLRLIALALTLAAMSALETRPAVAERLVASISRHQVLVNSSFTGTSIVLFGTVEPDQPGGRHGASDYDIVISVSGPKQTVTERRKERVLGIWTNVDSRTFLQVPGYLAVLADRPIDQIADLGTIRREQLGLTDKLLPQELGTDVGDVPHEDAFRVNFIRLKQLHKLYLENPTGVTLLTPTVFRAEIPLPAEAPIGNYDVDIRVFAGGKMVSRGTSAFEVIKVGFEQFVANAAVDYGVLYGLTTAAMALMTGWLASIIFRRD